MKTLKIGTLNRNIFSVAVIFLALLLLQSCATKMNFLNSSVVPAAEGSVTIKKDGNNNYAVNLKTTRLADPKRLSPSRSVYVVWMNTEQNGAKNIGQMKTSGSLLSSALKSSLQTVTTFKPVGFFITAEDNSDIQQPEGQVVLRTSNADNN
jgi:hypothetical protein